MNSLSWKCLAVLALALVVVGCGDGGPRLYKAGGTVTYKSAPVADAHLTFAYDNGNFANAVTGPDGKFQLTYMGKPGGAALGKVKVGITKEKNITVAAPAPNAKPKTPEEYKKMQAEKENAMKGYADAKAAQVAAGGGDLIPKKYKDAATSGLAFEITTDESKNNFEIKLED
jgi:hypothetical protein